MIARLFTIGIFSSLFWACGPVSRPADHLTPGFSSLAVDQVAVLPVVDLRPKKEGASAADIDKWSLPVAEHVLKQRHYNHTLYWDRTMVDSISKEDIVSPSQEWIAKLPPKQNRWVLLFALSDSSSGAFGNPLMFGATGTATMEAFLFDREKRIVAWREHEMVEMAGGGLLAIAMQGVLKRDAVKNGVYTVLTSLPVRE